MLTPLTAPQTISLARAALKSGHGAGLPELLKLIETLSKNIGETDISEIAELIEKDPAVLCRLLCVANTIVHNPNVAAMTSIPHAIHQLGFKRVRSLAVSLMLVENTGGAANPPEQREATAKALCAGLMAHGCAHTLGSVDPDLAFACAALRHFGHIILPVVSLELYREIPELMQTKSEDAAYQELFGLTPLELSRTLLGASKLPSEVLDSLDECHPESMSLSMASTHTARIAGVADFSCRLASLAMNSAHNAGEFDELSQELAHNFESLLPGVGTSLDTILVHTDERVGSYTRGEGSSSLSTPSLKRISARALHKSPTAVMATPVPVPIVARSSKAVVSQSTAASANADASAQLPAAAPALQPTAQAHNPNITQPATGVIPRPAPPKENVPVVPPAAPTTGALPVSTSVARTPTGPTRAVVATPVPEKWVEELTHTPAFETQAAAPVPVIDHWSATLTFVRDSFGAQECWLFIPAPGGESYSILQGVGAAWQDFRANAAVRADERTVFGICLARRENVVIHSTIEPTLTPYLPPWYRQIKGAPGAFILMPLHTESRTHGLVLVGWNLPQRLTITPAQTDLARQLFAAAMANSNKATPSRAA